MWSCCSYPRGGSRKGVKLTRNQRSTFGTMFAKSLFTKQRLEVSSFEKMTLHSLMMVVMTLYRCRSPTRYHLLRLGLMRAQCMDVLSEILPFFLVTIDSGHSEPNFSWQSVNMRFFSRVPWTMMSMKKGDYFGLYIRCVCMGWLMKWFSWYGQLTQKQCSHYLLRSGWLYH